MHDCICGGGGGEEGITKAKVNEGEDDFQLLRLFISLTSRVQSGVLHVMWSPDSEEMGKGRR